jgi:trans-aconitate methyltransferase
MTQPLQRSLWTPEEYHQNSSVQHVAATQALDFLELKGTERIIDIGCGDGRLTASIAERVRDGSVLGVDISPEMIGFAQTKFLKNFHPNLEFLCGDAQYLDYTEEFDIIFSSFAFQWFVDKNSFFQRAYKSLKPSGQLVMTVPLGISTALEASIDTIVSRSEWIEYFRGFAPGWHFIDQDKLMELIYAHRLTPVRFSTVIQETRFPSRNAFEQYVSQWFRYLNPLPTPLRQLFFKQVIDKYLELAPLVCGEQVRFTFSRVDIAATK